MDDTRSQKVDSSDVAEFVCICSFNYVVNKIFFEIALIDNNNWMRILVHIILILGEYNL